MNTSVFGVKASAMNLLADWEKAKEVEHRITRQQSLGERVWRKPPVEWIKINTDATCDSRTNKTGLGFLVRDDCGDFIRAKRSVMQTCMQPRIAKALSLREALSWIKDWRRTKCIFESDSKQLVDAINERRDKPYFGLIVDDCIELMKHYDEVLFVFAFRS